ncbi:unnamed protein product [Spodoptera exigua]|nr:unnamed protein product [Spodoptera exigua]
MVSSNSTSRCPRSRRVVCVVWSGESEWSEWSECSECSECSERRSGGVRRGHRLGFTHATTLDTSDTLDTLDTLDTSDTFVTHRLTSTLRLHTFTRTARPRSRAR